MKKTNYTLVLEEYMKTINIEPGSRNNECQRILRRVVDNEIRDLDPTFYGGLRQACKNLGIKPHIRDLTRFLVEDNIGLKQQFCISFINKKGFAFSLSRICDQSYFPILQLISKYLLLNCYSSNQFADWYFDGKYPIPSTRVKIENDEPLEPGFYEVAIKDAKITDNDLKLNVKVYGKKKTGETKLLPNQDFIIVDDISSMATEIMYDLINRVRLENIKVNYAKDKLPEADINFVVIPNSFPSSRIGLESVKLEGLRLDDVANRLLYQSGFLSHDRIFKSKEKLDNNLKQSFKAWYLSNFKDIHEEHWDEFLKQLSKQSPNPFFISNARNALSMIGMHEKVGCWLELRLWLFPNGMEKTLKIIALREEKQKLLKDNRDKYDKELISANERNISFLRTVEIDNEIKELTK